ncbi:MAG TPA: tryptophan 7-halogenase [Pyrinomonadaceae bacterium]|nr:tryptophan 7-halogenase [Pyrinomonadaceae bacterium]
MTTGGAGSGREAYDVAVVGGGPAGSAAALMLSRAGRRVLLAEANESNAFKIGEALPPAARPLLGDMGLWDGLAADGHLPCRGNLSAWGAQRLNETAFIFDPNGHGWHLDRARFDWRLREAARLSGSETYEATALKRLTRSPRGGWQLTLAGPRGETRASCRWLVDATGRRSALARRQGARLRQDDRLVAFFALFRRSANDAAPDEDSRTLIEAAADGWWYTALLPSKRRVVVYLTDADLISPRALCEKESYLSLLGRTEHIRARLAAHGYRMEDAPRGAAAHSARLDSFDGEGWLAVGDAALAFDPLSSQGMLTALFTGMEAGNALDAHLSGDTDAVNRYRLRLATIYEAYLRNLATYYSFEARWPDRDFWRRRHDGAARRGRPGHSGM